MDKTLTGIWHGLYSYPSYSEPVYFVATLISFGNSFTGTTHEAVEGRHGASLRVFASVSGSLDERAVCFVKQYDGTANWTHAVNYAGTLSPDASEIEGTWSIVGQWSGPFLMIRGSKVSESLVRRVMERV